jgi:hypothetical protein
MTQNYILEDGVNFWDMLNNENVSDSEEENICLLTKVPLIKNHIILHCGHKFNYLALLEEVKQQKARKHFINTIHFSYHSQFYCPYCRTVIDGLLPYISTECNEKIKFVNYPISLSIKHRECCYKYMSGKNKGQQCESVLAFESDIGTYCNKHHIMCKKKYSNNNNNTENDNSNTYNDFYKKHTIKEIKDILKQLNLPVSGNKKTLVERYFTHYQTNLS